MGIEIPHIEWLAAPTVFKSLCCSGVQTPGMSTSKPLSIFKTQRLLKYHNQLPYVCETSIGFYVSFVLHEISLMGASMNTAFIESLWLKSVEHCNSHKYHCTYAIWNLQLIPTITVASLFINLCDISQGFCDSATSLAFKEKILQYVPTLPLECSFT